MRHFLLAALLAVGPAVAGDYVARMDKDSIRLTDKPCPEAVLKHIPQGMRGFFRRDHVEINGKPWDACFALRPDSAVILVYEDGDNGLIPLANFQEEPGDLSVTTIFADVKKGVMVCDSKATSNAGVWFPCTKVTNVRGELIGVAGDTKEGDEWLAWHIAGRAGMPPPTSDEFSALILRKTGVYEVTAGAHEMCIERGFHGIGSGGGFAVAAFMAGADAKRSVDIACNVDPNSGGEVIVHKLKA